LLLQAVCNKNAEDAASREIHMHIPDGFINGGTSLAGGGLAAGGLALSVKQAGRTLDERQIPMAGLAASFVFAVQMLNFPVASGTSGHLLGGVLAAVLVGPWAGAICVSVVLFVQALLFADGGLSAIGLNVINMAFVGAFAGYGIFLIIRRVLPDRKGSVVVASGVAAALAPVLAACAFTLEYSIGGNGGASVGKVAAAMIGVHVLIGIGEGVITAMTISAVLASRPDLVHGARRLAPPLVRVPELVDAARS
jgi:cobalt/nickel transport system permease protein